MLRKYPNAIVMSSGWMTGGHGVKIDLRTLNSLKRLGLIDGGKLTQSGKTIAIDTDEFKNKIWTFSNVFESKITVTISTHSLSDAIMILKTMVVDPSDWVSKDDKFVVIY